MSDIPVLSSSKEKKRPSVSSKCLLNIKSIITQNVSLNNNNRNLSKSTPPPPLPLVSSKESIDHVEIEEKKTKSIPNRNVLNDVLHKSSENKTPITNGHDQSKVENDELPSNSSKESNSVSNKDSSAIPPLPLDLSMYPFGLSPFSPQTKPLSSFPVRSTNRINEEYVAQMNRIIASSSSSDNPDETKLIELPIIREQIIPVHKFDSASPTVSTIDDDDDVNFNSPIVIGNRSLNLPVDSPANANQTTVLKSRHSDRPNNQHQYHPRYPMNYARLPYSLRTKNSPLNYSSPTGSIPSPSFVNPPLRRPSLQFETVRTPAQKSPSVIPSELFDCCQTSVSQRHSHRRSTPTTNMENNLNESENRSNHFREVKNIREIMLKASKRLTQDLDSLTSLPIVDTHCHFDLIFDRLRIKHNDLKKYFTDYNEYYPSGLSFQLGIQVFWRPKQLTEDNWLNWYSKYLEDERVYGSCGIHPHWSSAWTDTSANDIERCLQHPKIVAIGEIGLDFGPKNECSEYEQYRAFENQLRLAAKWLKPIVIHSREAYKQTFDLLKRYLQPDHKIHLHCFVGNMDDVQLFTSYFTEIKFGFTPIITRSNFLHSVIQQLELTQILSETDSPYFVPNELHAHTRCAHPGMVYSVVEMVSQLRYLPVFDVACQLRENARHIYGV